jgi:hypothetical protein
MVRSFKLSKIMLGLNTNFFGKHMFNVTTQIKLCDNLICFSYKLWINFYIAIKLPKNQFINSICYKQPSNNFIIPYLFYTNKLVQKHNEIMFINVSRSFIFKAMDINHSSCMSSYKFSNDWSKIIHLHSMIHIKRGCDNWIMC